MSAKDQHFEFKDLKVPKGTHLDDFHHEKTVHQEGTTTRVVDHHDHHGSSESQRLLCLEAGEGPGASAGVCIRHALSCCLGCCCCSLVAALLVYRLITVGDFDSTMPDLVEPCRDVRETFCSVIRSIGMCAFWTSTCAYSCTSCIRFDEGVVRETKIQVSEVPTELAYAETGSNFPKSLQGIWWMDQDGYLAEKGLAGADYPFNFPPVGEYVITFGDDATWQPETRCLTPLYFWGGSRGHWAGANFGNGSTCCNGNVETRLTLALCFTDDTMQELDIWTRLPVASSLGLKYAGHDYWWVHKGLVHLTMVKTPWGWDRVSRAGADWTRDKREDLDALLSWLPGPLGSLLTRFLDFTNTTLRYPVWQIVDGDGNHTEYWQHFVDFTNIKTEQNQEPGTLIVRRRVDPGGGFTKFP